jgi:hypothetical protein
MAGWVPHTRGTVRKEPKVAYVYRRRSGVAALLVVAYIVIGIVVAASRNYFQDVDGIKDVISAALAVVLWPLVLARVNLRFR